MAERGNEKLWKKQHADTEKQIADIQFQAEKFQPFADGFINNVHCPLDFQAGIRINVEDSLIAGKKIAYGTPFVFCQRFHGICFLNKQNIIVVFFNINDILPISIKQKGAERFFVCHPFGQITQKRRFFVQPADFLAFVPADILPG